MTNRGLFVGLLTLDFIYLADGCPSGDRKIVATDYSVAAGGPATNAAVAFGYLGDLANVLSVVGVHPITHLIRNDLESRGIVILDLDSERSEPPPVSSIIITQATGERAVISIDATKTQCHKNSVCRDTTIGVDIVLVDGHQMQVGQAIVEFAKANDIPTVIDGGRWKTGFEEILPSIDYAICSADFYPPGCQNEREVITYLSSMGIPHIAITKGDKPIQYVWRGTAGSIEVPKVKAVDTLGAGDIFHGAFCYYIMRRNFTDALAAAAEVASRSCQFFGTRRWMESRL